MLNWMLNRNSTFKDENDSKKNRLENLKENRLEKWTNMVLLIYTNITYIRHPLKLHSVYTEEKNSFGQNHNNVKKFVHLNLVDWTINRKNKKTRRMKNSYVLNDAMKVTTKFHAFCVGRTLSLKHNSKNADVVATRNILHNTLYINLGVQDHFVNYWFHENCENTTFLLVAQFNDFDGYWTISTWSSRMNDHSQRFRIAGIR